MLQLCREVPLYGNINFSPTEFAFQKQTLLSLHEAEIFVQYCMKYFNFHNLYEIFHNFLAPVARMRRSVSTE